jgi:glycosyltransferase involved in cell wall biosynthesis
VIVTPAHNEEDNLMALAQCVSGQTLLPTEWVIVDDASDDRTFDVARNIADGRSWVRVVHHDHEKGCFNPIFKAFKFGVDQARTDWRFLVKLDADMVLSVDHIERLVAKFEADSALGIASGVSPGELGISLHPRGTNRMYRKECWQIVKFPESGWGWDTVDEVFARLDGWRTAAFSDIVCEHVRSKLHFASYRFLQGRISRHIGYYWWFALARSTKLLLSLGVRTSIAYLAGYLRGGLGEAEMEIKQKVKEDQMRRIRQILRSNSKVSTPVEPFQPAFDGNDPLVVIGMPTKNRRQYLPRVLDALYECDYPRARTRLVFVDGFSDDGTYELLQQFASNHKGEYEDIVLVQAPGNIPSARNVCIQYVKNGENLAFLDSDVLVNPDFLRVLIALAKAGGIASIQYVGSKRKLQPAVILVGNVGMGCTIIRNDVLKSVGVFDSTLPVGEDTDYCLRARTKGFEIVQDNTRQFLHFDEGRYRPAKIIPRSFRYRKVYGKIFWLGEYLRRFLLYLILDVCLALGILLNYLFLMPILAYFFAQLIRKRGVRLATYTTVNSLIIGPLAVVGLIERRLDSKLSSQPKG